MRSFFLVASLAAFATGLAIGPSAAKVLVVVDKSAQQMTVSVDGDQRWVWPVSTGVPRYDTPSGRFTAFRLEKDHFSKEWDDAPMPYSIFFTNKGHAIHGTNHTSIGNPASHGCVRLNTAHAAQLFALVQQQGVANTTVVLTGDVQIAWANRASRLAAARGGAATRPVSQQFADPAPPPSRDYRRGYDETAPRYGNTPVDTPSTVYGRAYTTCPLPPPGFPVPACSYARPQARADAAYPPRRYDYGQPQYEPDDAPRRGFPFGGY
jgi:hypothetical protein